MHKKFGLILIAAILMVFFIPTGLPVCAVSTPHVVIEGEVWLLDSQGSRLFLLPETYYAKIDNMDNDFYFITFNGISGKVGKNLVSTIGYHTQASGTMQELRIDPQYYDFKTIALKSSMDGGEEILLPVNDSFIFLGEYPLTEMWYCIRYNDKIGYIKAARTTAPNIQIPVFKPEQPQQPNTSGGGSEIIDTPKEKASLLRILIIAGLCVPAVILIFLLFKPQKPRKRRYYYDE
jgi:hypothetical protein